MIMIQLWLINIIELLIFHYGYKYSFHDKENNIYFLYLVLKNHNHVNIDYKLITSQIIKSCYWDIFPCWNNLAIYDCYYHVRIFYINLQNIFYMENLFSCCYIYIYKLKWKRKSLWLWNYFTIHCKKVFSSFYTTH